MTKNIVLKAESRDLKAQTLNELRQKGFLPAVIYGQGEKAQNLKINENDFIKAYEVAGESSLIDLDIDKKGALKTIIKNIQIDPVKNKIIHADIYKVDMKKKIEIEIPLNFVGESKAEKELNGILMKNHETVTAQALPSDLIESLEIDISSLETFNDNIKAKDLKLPAGIELITDIDDTIVHVVEPKIQDEKEIQVEEDSSANSEEEKKEDAQNESKVEDKKE